MRRGRTGAARRRGAYARPIDDCALPTEENYCRENATTSTTSLLDLLTEIKAKDQIEEFLKRTHAGEGWSEADNRAVIDALAVLAPRERLRVVEHLINESSALCFAACADLLARAAKAWADLTAAELRTVADRLLAFCPNDRAQASDVDGPRPDGKVAADLIGALCRIDSQVRDRAVEALLSSPKTFDMDRCLVPALRELVADPDPSVLPAGAQLGSACVEHLRTRIAVPLAPPADFRRANRLTCACADCESLGRFLDDPTLASWSLKAAERARSHVEATIRSSHCDVDTTTERRGSPHRLVVTKNQASYERLAKQRREDVKNLAWIEGAADQ